MAVYWPYYLHTARRGLLLWLAVRVVLLGGTAAVGAPSVLLSPLALLMLVGVVAVLCRVDARLMREQIFHANLGTPTWVPVAVGTGTAVVLEIGTAFLLTAVS